MRIFLALCISLLLTVEAWAAPYWLINGGSNGSTDRSSIGIEVGGTRAIRNQIPLAAELSMNFQFEDEPSDTHFNFNSYNEPYTLHTVKYGPEIGYLFKSGVNLDDWVKNLTFQVGAGYSLQSEETIGTGLVSGKHWQQGHRRIAAHAVGYGGLLYRFQNICFSAGYNNRRGVVAGIGSSW